MTVTGKIFKWSLIFIVSLFGFAVAASMVVVVLGVRMNLDTLRPVVEAAVSTALNRKVRITGPVRLQPTLRPILEIQGVRIDNPPGWSEEVFASLDFARVQVGIPALLKKRIDVGEITCTKVTLNFETNRDGVNNWRFDTAGSTVPELEKDAGAEPGNISLQALDTLSLQDIRVIYRDNSLGKVLTFALDELSGTAEQGEPLLLQGKGGFQDKPYSFTLEGGPLEDFHPGMRMYPLAVTGTIVGSPFTAKGALGMDRSEPKLDLDLTLADVDIGGLLSWLQVAEGVESRTDELALQLNLRGDSLRELVTESNMLFTLRGGRYTLHGAGKGDGVPITIDRGEVSTLSGRPVAVSLDGALDSTPITIAIQGMELINYVGRPRQLPVTVTVEAAATRLELNGKVALPVGSKDLSLGMTIQGEKLDSLDQLLGVDLPPLGPYSLKARFAMQENGYDLSDLMLRVGSSDLSGSLRLDLAGAGPVAEVQLVSSLLQIDDFDTGDWSPEGRSAAEQAQGKTVESNPTGKQERQGRAKAAALLSRETLSRADARLGITLEKVMSGRDLLGVGRLEAVLRDGRFSVNPLELTLADGTADVVFSYAPGATDAEIHLAATVTDLNVGILAHRIDPKSTMAGRLTMDILLDATAPELDRLMANGRGHFDLAFFPENFNAGLLDMWAVNLLAALAEETDGEADSVINCLVASFGMEDGLMRERTLFIDTTNMSIEGAATMNFKNRTVAVKAVPRAKKPEFFSLATPVWVKGSFDDIGVNINMIRMAGTITSFITSPLHVPLRRIFSGTVPEDGKEACQQAWEKRNLRQ